MDMSDKDKIELEKRNDNLMNYHFPGSMSSDWQFNTANIATSPLCLVPTDSQILVCRGDLVGASTCSSASMVNSFGTPVWDHSAGGQNLGFYDISVQNNSSTANVTGILKEGTFLRSGVERALDMAWNPTNSLLKGGIFLPNPPGMLPHNLSQFPADPAFIEHAARFSCFNGGNFSDVVNPFRIPESMGLYSRADGTMQGLQEVYTGSGLKSISGGQVHAMNVDEASKDVPLSNDHVGTDQRSPPKNDRKSESLVRSHEEAKHGVGGSGNESDEAEFSGGGGGQDEPSMLDRHDEELSGKGIGGLRKRKRNGQDTELDLAKGLNFGEASKDNPENQQKGDQNLTSTTNKTAGKQGKLWPQASDPPKEEYIHVRARRGQATNSHSLAERVRREKISERMKFLQDLVPGCSKVTGKAVMLDEIINYVQSLQRQVEFLSMKLATVNPRLDFNLEGLLAKDILQSRAVPSSTLGFSPDMPMAYTPLPPSQPGLVQVAFPAIDSHPDALRRTINSQLKPMTGGFKKPTRLPNVWDGGLQALHNVVQSCGGASSPQDSQDINGSHPPGHMKAEP